MAGGVYPVICSRLYLSAYGKDHYEILHWWICLLENVLDSANVRDFSLCGSERMYSRKEKNDSGCMCISADGTDHRDRKESLCGGQAIYQKSVNMQKLPADACQIST